MTTCRVCEAQIKGTAVTCRRCIELLLDDLRVLLGWRGHDGRIVTGLLDDLVILATRQDRMPALGTNRDTRDERTLDHRYPVAVATVPTPGRFDALALRRDVLTVIEWIRRGVREFGVARLHQHPHSDDWVNQISATNGYRLRIERMVDRPNGAFRIPCPQCGRRVPMDVDADFVRCRCGEYGTVGWWQQHVAPEVPEPGTTITARDAVLWLAVRHDIDVTEPQIRQWAARGRVTRSGKATDGRTLYPAADLLTLARPDMSVPRIPKPRQVS